MNKDRMPNILLAPVVTEKSNMVGESSNQYVFKVLVDANKGEIKNAVEKLFNVNVDSGQVLNMKGKVKRFGQRLGRRKDSKKAYVRLQAGNEIDFAGGE